MQNQPTPETALLRAAYAAFNARDIEAALALWTEQWSEVDPRVEPVEFFPDDVGQVLVEVRQVVRDLGGSVLADERVGHHFTIEDGLIRAMEVCPFPS